MSENLISFVGFGESLGSEFIEAEELKEYHPPKSEFLKLGTILAFDNDGYYIRLIELSNKWKRGQREIFAKLKFREVKDKKDELISDPINHGVAHGFFLRQSEFIRTVKEINGKKETKMEEIMHWTKMIDGEEKKFKTSWLWIGYRA